MEGKKLTTNEEKTFHDIPFVIVCFLMEYHSFKPEIYFKKDKPYFQFYGYFKSDRFRKAFLIFCSVDVESVIHNSVQFWYEFETESDEKEQKMDIRNFLPKNIKNIQFSSSNWKESGAFVDLSKMKCFKKLETMLGLGVAPPSVRSVADVSSVPEEVCDKVLFHNFRFFKNLRTVRFIQDKYGQYAPPPEVMNLLNKCPYLTNIQAGACVNLGDFLFQKGSCLKQLEKCSIHCGFFEDDHESRCFDYKVGCSNYHNLKVVTLESFASIETEVCSLLHCLSSLRFLRVVGQGGTTSFFRSLLGNNVCLSVDNFVRIINLPKLEKILLFNVALFCNTDTKFEGVFLSQTLKEVQIKFSNVKMKGKDGNWAFSEELEKSLWKSLAKIPTVLHVSIEKGMKLGWGRNLGEVTRNIVAKNKNVRIIRPGPGDQFALALFDENEGNLKITTKIFP